MDFLIKLPKEQRDLFDSIGTIIHDGTDTYRYMPYWFKDTDDEGVFKVIDPCDMPDELIDTLKDFK